MVQHQTFVKKFKNSKSFWYRLKEPNLNNHEMCIEKVEDKGYYDVFLKCEILKGGGLRGIY